MTLIKKAGSQFLHGKTQDGCDVYVWQNGYDNNLVQIVRNSVLVEQQTGSMNEVVKWLTPLGVYNQ